jgi:hypothetical protein
VDCGVDGDYTSRAGGRRMKWKRNVTVRIVQGDCYRIQYEKSIFHVPTEDAYIIRAMEHGMTKDKDLIRLVMDEEHTDEVEAGARMAEIPIWGIP